MSALTPERLDEIERALDVGVRGGDLRALLALARRVVAPDGATVEAVAKTLYVCQEKQAVEDAGPDCPYGEIPWEDVGEGLRDAHRADARAALAAVAKGEGK